MHNNFTIPAKTLLFAAKLKPSAEELVQLNQLLTEVEGWDAAVHFLISRQAGPLLYKKLPLLSNSNKIPAAAMEALRQSSLKTLSRNMVLTGHFTQIARAFEEAEIPLIAMKGIYLSEWLYGDIGLRQFSDIDILVHPEKGLQAVALLEKMGYHASEQLLPEQVQSVLQSVHYPAMVKQGVSVEVHTRLHRAQTAYQIDLDGIWSCSELKTVQGASVHVFALEHQLLTLIQHLDKHYRSGEYQFTSLYDIANLLALHSDKMDMTKLLQWAAAWNMESLLFSYSALMARYFGLQLPKPLQNAKPEEMIEHILRESLSVSNMREAPGMKRRQAESSIKTIGLYETKSQKLRYALRMTFPPAAYLKQHYGFTANRLLPRYYLKRVGDNVRLLRKAGLGALLRAFGEERE